MAEWKKASENEPHHLRYKDLSWKSRFSLLNGKIRRFFIGHFGKKRIKESLECRENECARCGACCKLLFKCLFLTVDDQGYYSCSIHKSRPVNCRIYPVDMRDIRERNMIAPDTKCGYSFKKLRK